MLISTKGRYALRVLIDIAEHQTPTGYIPLQEIADRQEISEKYLESIVKTLVTGGILVGLRGKGGGYRMNMDPEKCTVNQVLRLTEGSLAPVACLESSQPICNRLQMCRTLPMWQGLDELISNYFEGFTIADLAQPVQPGDDYVI